MNNIFEWHFLQMHDSSKSKDYKNIDRTNQMLIFKAFRRKCQLNFSDFRSFFQAVKFPAHNDGHEK